MSEKTKKQKCYNSLHIQNQFSKLTKDKKIGILWDALDIMQQFNGRSRFDCIVIAMGYSNYKGEDSTYTKNTEA